MLTERLNLKKGFVQYDFKNSHELLEFERWIKL